LTLHPAPSTGRQRSHRSRQSSCDDSAKNEADGFLRHDLPGTSGDSWWCQPSPIDNRGCILLDMPNTTNRLFSTLLGLVLCGLLFLFSEPCRASDCDILSRSAAIDGVQIHYLTAGHGPFVILLHGYAETSHMWRPIMPLLAKRFTVVAPDLPGIGDSAIPNNGLDMKSAAIRIHGLARSLGIDKAEVVGHDIGLMVAYAYAAQFSTEVGKLVVMDAFLPGVGGWETVYNDPRMWHFRFNGPTPGSVGARARTYLLRILLE
jgi:hypothetical protein